MMIVLKFFDFDGTLFRSPDPPNRDLWEVSLEPPLVPRVPNQAWWIQEVLQAAREAIADPDVYAVLMTGRTSDLFEDRVHELLAQQGLEFDEVHLTTPGVETTEFKSEKLAEILAKLNNLNDEVDMVVIYDDSFDRMVEYQRIIEGNGIPCEIHWVHDGRLSSDSSFIHSSLVNKGRRKAGNPLDKRVFNILRRTSGAMGLPPAMLDEMVKYYSQRLTPEEYEKIRTKEQRTRIEEKLGRLFNALAEIDPNLSDQEIGNSITRALVPMIFPVGKQLAAKLMHAYTLSNGDFKRFVKNLEKAGIIRGWFRRLIKLAMVTPAEKEEAAYALRNAQATHGWKNFVTALFRGDWDWPTFEARARSRLRAMPGKRRPEVEDYVMKRLQDLYNQGSRELLYNYTANVL